MGLDPRGEIIVLRPAMSTQAKIDEIEAEVHPPAAPAPQCPRPSWGRHAPRARHPAFPRPHSPACAQMARTQKNKATNAHLGLLKV